MKNEDAINTLNSLKQYYNDKNEDSYVGFDKNFELGKAYSRCDRKWNNSSDGV